MPGATVLPAFDDTHTHLIFAALGAHDVPVHQARTIPEFLDLIRQRATTTPEGEWIRTTTNWQELNLAERRLPTAAELDRATDRHPVLVKRGGHNDVVNTYALRLAGITEDTPVPLGGVIGRDADGHLNGRLIDNALPLVERLLPAPDRAGASTDCAWPAVSTPPPASAPCATARSPPTTTPYCRPLARRGH
ncbi:amidohydrolase family protein [Streptomyces sp. NPDC001410]|uniref:amidohydrolase family protein n=1 Tax=Streptomyces sp. NPDC001410 TaxID=3364574 RepID=UPI0036766063